MDTDKNAQAALGPTSSDSDQNSNHGRIVRRTLATGQLMNNLPYMGEMTFDSRPRRGRKPKKANICHLISKNYGISFPLTYVNHPNSRFEDPLFPQVSLISGQSPTTAPYEELGTIDEPLNLCVRDRIANVPHLVKPSPMAVHQPSPKRRKTMKKVQTPVQSHYPSPHPPPSEVSICKFKFTGGVRPTLQEKKMLSVDSGGNFRFYSDKQPSRTKGQQGQIIAKDPPTLPPPPLLPPPLLEPDFLPASPSAESSTSDDSGASPTDFGHKRKRRTRKSLMREKLEKTFKEKGFLIQTQQLESAEGATYCKFRQLRKFTRYLFRSWKDYLPETVQGITPNTENQLSETVLETVTNDAEDGA